MGDRRTGWAELLQALFVSQRKTIRQLKKKYHIIWYQVDLESWIQWLSRWRNPWKLKCQSTDEDGTSLAQCTSRANSGGWTDSTVIIYFIMRQRWELAIRSTREDPQNPLSPRSDRWVMLPVGTTRQSRFGLLDILIFIREIWLRKEWELWVTRGAIRRATKDEILNSFWCNSQ